MTAASWQAAINEMLDNTLLTENDDESLLLDIRKHLDQLKETNKSVDI